MNQSKQWTKSLELLHPKNIKTNILETLNILKVGYTTWIRYWWWLIGAYLVGCIFVFRPIINLSTSFLVNGIFHDIPSLATVLIASTLILVLYATIFSSLHQPSQKKNYAYFLKYKNHILLMVIWFSFVSCIHIAAEYLIGQMVDLSYFLSLVLISTISIFIFLFNSFFMATIFDPKMSLNDIKMILTKTMRLTLSNLVVLIYASFLAGIYVALLFGIITLFRVVIVSLMPLRNALIFVGTSVECIHAVVDLLIALPVWAATLIMLYSRSAKIQ